MMPCREPGQSPDATQGKGRDKPQPESPATVQMQTSESLIQTDSILTMCITKEKALQVLAPA